MADRVGYQIICGACHVRLVAPLETDFPNKAHAVLDVNVRHSEDERSITHEVTIKFGVPA